MHCWVVAPMRLSRFCAVLGNLPKVEYEESGFWTNRRAPAAVSGEGAQPEQSISSPHLSIDSSSPPVLQLLDHNLLELKEEASEKDPKYSVIHWNSQAWVSVADHTRVVRRNESLRMVQCSIHLPAKCPR